MMLWWCMICCACSRQTQIDQHAEHGTFLQSEGPPFPPISRITEEVGSNDANAGWCPTRPTASRVRHSRQRGATPYPGRGKRLEKGASHNRDRIPPPWCCSAAG